MKKGDRSKFIEDAVRCASLDQTVAEAGSKFADMPPDELGALLEEAVAETRQACEPKAEMTSAAGHGYQCPDQFLLASSPLPAHLIVLWREGRFDLLTSADQIEELMVGPAPRFLDRG